MKETPAERHDRLTRLFVTQNLRPIVHKSVRNRDESMGEMMIVTESLLLGIMTILREVYGFNPEMAATMLEGCLDQAMARFGEHNK